MEIIRNEYKLCFSCMEEHEIEVVEVVENNIFKGEQVEFIAIYEYCSNAQAYSQTEEMIKKNDLAFKDAYRKKKGLLTSSEIRAIREKYGVSQKEFSEILDWGKVTITRYENHQVQDRAHDDILRKIDTDPKWFMQMLKRSMNRISPKMYSEYYLNASEKLFRTINPYSYGSINTKVVFNAWGSKDNMVEHDKCNYQNYDSNACDNFLYLTKPFFIDEKVIFA